jgi:cell division protein FtsQ
MARSGVARAEAVRALRRRGLRRLAVLLATVLGTALLVFLLLFSSVLGARTVDVIGANLLSADDVRAAAGVSAGHPLLRLDAGEVADRVRRLPPVAGVQVQRSWPSTVIIRITERAPLAFAPVDGGVQLVDATGLRYATVPQPPPGVPELRAADGASTVAAASVLAALADPSHDQLRAELAVVRADSPYDVRLTLRGDRTVRWGSADNSDRKAAVLAVLLGQRGSVYDVASPDLPTVRS